MHEVCTYFDRNYIHRGLALYRSLRRTAPGGFRLWTVCLDDVTYETLCGLNLDGLQPVHLKEVEHRDEPLSLAKKTRSKIEYYWTLTPSLPLYLFGKYSDIEKILYVDADIYFFSSPGILFDELGDKSVLIVPHDYSDEYKRQEHSGKYNVGTLVFRADEKGTDCLRWWRERCLEWCYARHENGKFGDQGYLNDWPERFEGVVVPKNIGIRPAPWNIGKYILSQGPDGVLRVARTPLVCYHFHALTFCTSWLVFLAGCQVEMSEEWRSQVYRPYVKELKSVESYLRERGIPLPITQSGFPWRYIGGRILKRESVRHFLLNTC